MAQQSLTSVLGPAKFNHWYETIIDFMIANPEISKGEIARRLGRSQPWVSLVIGSDSFKARYAKRREDHSRRISENVENRLHNVATAALDRLAQTLEKKDLTPQFTLDATDVLLQRLGYTGRGKASEASGGAGHASGPNNTVIQVFHPISAPTLVRAQTEIRNREAVSLEAEANTLQANTLDEVATYRQMAELTPPLEATTLNEVEEDEPDTAVRETDAA